MDIGLQREFKTKIYMHTNISVSQIINNIESDNFKSDNPHCILYKINKFYKQDVIK